MKSGIEEKVKNNNNKTSLPRKMAAFGCNLRKKGPFYKHFGGFLVSFVYAKLGKEKQTKKEKIWNVGPGYFTKWDTTAWYGLSHLYQYGPLFGASKLLDLATGVSEGDYVAAGLWITGTLQNLVRGISSWIFKKPLPAIGLIETPIQLYYYRDEIKNKYNKLKQDFLQEREELMKGY